MAGTAIWSMRSPGSGDQLAEVPYLSTVPTRLQETNDFWIDVTAPSDIRRTRPKAVSTRKSRKSTFTVYSDATATSDNFTALEDARRALHRKNIPELLIHTMNESSAIIARGLYIMAQAYFHSRQQYTGLPLSDAEKEDVRWLGYLQRRIEKTTKWRRTNGWEHPDYLRESFPIENLRTLQTQWMLVRKDIEKREDNDDPTLVAHLADAHWAALWREMHAQCNDRFQFLYSCYVYKAWDAFVDYKGDERYHNMRCDRAWWKESRDLWKEIMMPVVEERYGKWGDFVTFHGFPAEKMLQEVVQWYRDEMSEVVGGSVTLLGIDVDFVRQNFDWIFPINDEEEEDDDDDEMVWEDWENIGPS